MQLLDKGGRVRLIMQIRDHLQSLAYDDAELLLATFGAGPLSNGWQDLSFQQVLLACEDETLIELSSHTASEEDRPLLVFGSHLVAYKGLVAGVEAALKTFGIDLFVAHTHINPEEEWQNVIVEHLDKADAGLAFLHPEFGRSTWCDQEIGWLLARKIPVPSLMFDQAPYGILARKQGIPAGNLRADQIADAVIRVYMGYKELHPQLASSLIAGMRASKRFNDTDRIWLHLQNFRNLTAKQCLALKEAARVNDQVFKAPCPYISDEERSRRPNEPIRYGEVIERFLHTQPGFEAPINQPIPWSQSSQWI